MECFATRPEKLFKEIHSQYCFKIKCFSSRQELSICLEKSKHSSNPSNILTIHKGKSILIKIVKQEWSTDWRSFIPDICEASQQDQNVCENSLEILKMLR